jgi:hypothetical protein
MVYPLPESIEPEIERLVTRTNLACAHCGDPLHLVEEAWEFKIVQPEYRGALLLHDVLNPMGGLAYEPHFFEFVCWEAAEELVQELWEDVPPVLDELGLLSCDICGSHIREHETMGLARFGEIHCSPHTPDGQISYKFEPMGTDRHVCIGCLTHINDELDLWEQEIEGLPGVPACRDGLFERCWRKGTCTCDWRR